MLSNKFLSVAGAPEPTDAQFNYVTMLLHGDGTNGAQNNTFLDSSTNNFTITRNGNTTQGSFSPYGSNWGVYLNGSSKLRTTSFTPISAGQDFTLEAWIYPTLSTPTDLQCLATPRVSSGSWYFGTYQDKVFFYDESASVFQGSTVALNTWQHIAFSRSGTTHRLFLNGVLSATITATAQAESGAQLALGSDFSNNNTVYTPFYGYVSNFRVVIGTALYTSSFTPSTTPLTAVSGTAFLGFQSNRFVDNSSNAYTISVSAGAPSVQRFNPFGTSTAYSTATIGGSGYFDGIGDTLATPSSAGFTFGTGDFTIETWINWSQLANAPSSEPGVFQTSTTSGGFQTTYTSGVLLAVFGGNYNVVCGTDYSGRLTSSYAVKFNTWDHVAVVRSSGTLTIYVNGVSAGSQSNTSNITATYAGIGSYYSSSYAMNGYISNFRVVKGTAVYTSTFTPPTAPLTAVSGTSLLLNYTNGAIYDNAMMNDLETVGNAQISTSVVKYGTGSVAIAATGDRLQTWANNPNLVFGTGDFTVECWVYITSLAAENGVFQISATPGGIYSSSLDNVSIYTTSTTSFDFTAANGYRTGGIAPTLNTWTHLALVRLSGVTKLYVNGVFDTTAGAITDTQNYTGGYICIGAEHATNTPLKGYVDDFRVTKGYARYTANFTPPAAALSDKGPI